MIKLCFIGGQSLSTLLMSQIDRLYVSCIFTYGVDNVTVFAHQC